MVLGASNYTYAEATRSQQLVDFVSATARGLDVMNKLLISVLGAGFTIGFAAPAFAQQEDPHSQLHEDLGDAHARLHESGVDWGPGHEAWHERGERLHTLDHMQHEAVAPQYGYRGTYAPAYAVPPQPVQTYYAPAPAYYAPNQGYYRNGRGHFSVGFGW